MTNVHRFSTQSHRGAFLRFRQERISVFSPGLFRKCTQSLIMRILSNSCMNWCIFTTKNNCGILRFLLRMKSVALQNEIACNDLRCFRVGFILNQEIMHLFLLILQYTLLQYIPVLRVASCFLELKPLLIARIKNDYDVSAIFQKRFSKFVLKYNFKNTQT